jgi:uncharacterized protein
MIVEPSYRKAIAEYIRSNAQPVDKFSHQPRLYELACSLADGQPYDDDVLYAAVWMHDIGVFVGHRPEEPDKLASWDHIAYAVKVVPELLRTVGFPTEKIPGVVEAMRTHLPAEQPATAEGTLLRDADILEQLGAVGILRVVSKVGRDTRFPTHAEAVRLIRQNVKELPGKLNSRLARRMAEPRVAVMEAFLRAVDDETNEQM